MCTLVCSFPATLSHLGHPSGGGSAQVPSAEWWHCCWPQPPPTLGDTQSGPCSSMHLLGGHQCLSMAPPAPPVALPHLRPLCPYQAERAGCWAGSLPQPTTLLLPPGHAAPACSACCPPPVGAWGQGSRGVCPPPALGERCRRSLCCHARQRGCVGVSPVPGGLWLCQEQRDLTGAPLIPNPLS